MSDSECTTDAMPSPPRDKENVYRKYEKKKPKVPAEQVGEEEIQNKRNDSNSNSIPPPNHGFNNRPTQPGKLTKLLHHGDTKQTLILNLVHSLYLFN